MSGRVKLIKPPVVEAAPPPASGRVRPKPPSTEPNWHGWEWCPDQKDMPYPHYLAGKNKKTEAWMGFNTQGEAEAFAARNPLAGFNGIPKEAK